MDKKQAVKSTGLKARAKRKSQPAGGGKKPKRKSRTKAGRTDYAEGLVASVQKKIREDKGDPSIIGLSIDGILGDVTEWIPTMFRGLDEILGGGWAVGRISEVFGPEGAGKSSLTHMAIKAVQAVGGTAVFIDFEASLESHVLGQLGIDEDRLIYVSPMTCEEGWDVVWSLLDELKARPPDAPVLIVWDSIAAAPTKEELSKSAGDRQYPSKARIMSMGCRKIYLSVAKVRVHMMFVNQERENIKSTQMYAEPVTPGGKGVRYVASQRLRVTRKQTLKKTVDAVQVATGYRVKCETKKCRLAPPHQTAEWILDFTDGPSPDLTLFDELKRGGIITGAGTKYTVPWYGSKFKSSEWLRLLREEDGAFRADAEAVCTAMYAGSSGVESGEDLE